MAHRSIASSSRPFEPYLIDPSVLTSSEHISTLLKYRGKLFLPSPVYNLIKRREFGRLNEILRFFAEDRAHEESYERLSRLCAHCKMFEIRPRMKILKSYTPQGFANSIDVPLDVGRILAEELAFIETHSSLLLRTMNAINHFKKAGKHIVDVTNDLHDKKAALFRRIRGPKWIFAVALGLSGTLIGAIPGLLLATGATAVAFFDP